MVTGIRTLLSLRRFPTPKSLNFLSSDRGGPAALAKASGTCKLWATAEFLLNGLLTAVDHCVEEIGDAHGVGLGEDSPLRIRQRCGCDGIGANSFKDISFGGRKLESYSIRSKEFSVERG